MLVPETSVSPLWIAAPLFDNHCRFDSPVSGETDFRGHTSSVTSLAVSRDGSRVVSGGSDAALRLWDAATGREIRTFLGHEGIVTSVAISPDGKTVLSGSADKKAILWNIATARVIRRIEGHEGRVKAVYVPGGRLVLTGGHDKKIKLWDIGRRRRS